jgi:glycosyltransferase involved in cell wall biosynthesis
MKIAITTVQAPFIRGGAELLAENLKTALIQHGHEAEIITMPLMDNPLELLENHVVAARLLEVERTWAGLTDLCIGLKFPAYCIPHSNKVIWALHQHRAAYDLFNTDFSNIRDDLIGNNMRRVIFKADNRYLPEAKRIYTIAQNVSNRMERYNHIKSTPLYHPCPDMDKFYCEPSENYILMPSRINITKRQFLAVQAMCETKSNIKLYIMGTADNDIEKKRLLDYIRENRIERKIKFLDYVSQEEKFRLYARAKGILFIPLDEDYGYITLEAMAASKPVITAKDSGGPLEFVIHSKTGLIVEPKPISLAEAIDQLARNDAQAEKWGIDGRKRLQDMGVSWDHVVKELTKK